MKRAIILASGLTALAVLMGNSVSAAPTPASCFRLQSGDESVIEQYYEHESNDSTNPACPTDVEIPSEIVPGVPIEEIAPGSFAGRSLTSVVIPSTIKTIGGSSFSVNRLTSLTIPSSVETIGLYAFAENRLEVITVEGNPTFDGGDVGFAIPGQGGVTGNNPNNPGSFFVDTTNITIPTVYAPNITPALTSRIFREIDLMGSDMNADGDTVDIVSGYVANPVRLTLRYLDERGNELRHDEVRYGDNRADLAIRATDLDVAYPGLTSAMFADMYYKLGDIVTQSPLYIAGYITPVAQHRTLVVGEGTVVFTYVARTGGTTGGEVQVPLAPDAGTGGLQEGVWMAGVVSVVLVGVAVQVRRWYIASF